MPVYCYRKPDGGVVDLPMSIAEMERQQNKQGEVTLDDGLVVTRDYVTEHGGFRSTPGTWPMLSDAAGVNPDYAKEETAQARRLGVPINFTSEGEAIFTSAKHRRDYCNAMGLHDRNGGYSDPDGGR